VSPYQKGKTNLDFTEARDSEWQWHRLGHMQVCISLQTDYLARTPPLSFLQAGCPSCHPTNSVKALKAVLCAVYSEYFLVIIRNTTVLQSGSGFLASSVEMMELSSEVNGHACVEQQNALVPEASQASSDSTDTAIGSSCTSCCDVEAPSPPFPIIGDNVPKATCDGADCTITQSLQISEAGAGETGIVTVEEHLVDIPPTSSDYNTGSDTTSLLSASSDSKSTQDILQTAEQTAQSDGHLTRSKKLSLSRERPQIEGTVKPSRPQWTANETVPKPCKSLP